MVMMDGRGIEWREGLTVEHLVLGAGKAEGVTFASVDGLLVQRLDWPTTTVADGSTVKLVSIVAGG
jgi:thiamine biosynthesis protein ThiS